MELSAIARVNRIIKMLADYEGHLVPAGRQRARTGRISTRLIAGIVACITAGSVMLTLVTILRHEHVELTMSKLMILSARAVLSGLVGVMITYLVAGACIAFRPGRPLFARYLLPERRLTSKDVELVGDLLRFDLTSLRLARLKRLRAQEQFEDNAAFAFGKAARHGVLLGLIAVALAPQSRALPLLLGVSGAAWFAITYLETKSHMSRAQDFVSLAIQLKEEGAEPATTWPPASSSRQLPADRPGRVQRRGVV